MMITANAVDLQLERLLFGDSHGVSQPFNHQPRRFSCDGFAQKLLIDRMKSLGFQHQSLPALPLFGAAGDELAGHRFIAEDGMMFEAYAASDGVALVTAAHEACTGRQTPFADDDGDEDDRLLDAAG